MIIPLNLRSKKGLMRNIYPFYSNVLLKGFVLPFYFRLLRFFFKLFGVFAKVSLSQFSEDLIIDIILKNAKKKKGIFIDVGCNHPIEYNNTYQFYLRGRKCINIDGNKELISLYKQFRKNDISINSLVSDKEEIVAFHLSTSDKLSTIHSSHIDSIGEKKFPNSKIVEMNTQTLNSILEINLKPGEEIDLLCIDVERHEFEVISSINLDYYKPYLIVIEMHDFSPINFSEHKIFKLLNNHYSLEHYVFSSGYFIRK